MRQKGKLARWDDDKGFGFIEPNNGGNRVFVHINEFANRTQRPMLNDFVTYETAKDAQGRVNAVDAALGNAKSYRRRGPKGQASAILFSLLFLGGLGALAYIGQLRISFGQILHLFFIPAGVHDA